MKRNILLLLSLCMLLLTCSDSNDPIKEIEKPKEENPFITLKKANIDFTNDGGSESILIESNVTWTTKSSAGWCTVTPSSGNKSTESITIAATENKEYDNRSCTVTLESGNISKTITVNQGENLGLLITQDRYELGNEESTIKVEVKANVDFEVEINDEWITQVETRGLTTSELEFKIAKNDTYGNREGSITIKQKGGNMSSTITVYQSQEDALILSKKDFDLSNEAQSIDVEVKTNIDYEIIIPEDAKDWVTHSKTRALRTETVVLDIAQNKDYEERTVEVIVKDKKTDLEETVTIKQAANTGIIVNVETPGTLKELLGKDFLTIGMLTIKGEINGADINTIREMGGSDRVLKPTNGVLYKLDLTNAQIVEGGNAYCYPDFSTYDACYTSNDVLGNFMFYKCNKLKEIILPKTILEIKDYAISWCDNLENIVINESVEYIGQRGLSTNRKLINVNLPDNIKIIERWALSNNHSLESIVLPRNLKSIGESLFAFCKKLKSIEFPPNVTTINDFAFEGCEGLETINITDSINIVGPHAFYKCINIKRVTFGSNVSSIGHDAFNYCDQITEIYCKNPIPPTLGTTLYISPTFTQTVFKNCNVYIPKGSYESYYTSLMWRYFDKLIETDF